MGCDIHMFVEYKKTINKEEKWVSGDYFKRDPFFNALHSRSEFEVIELHGNRDYALFSTLAGVRAYTDECIPVSGPKGIPDDSCNLIKDECEEYGNDGHTHSWLSLKELRDYQNENPKFTYSGLLSLKQRLDLDSGIQPDSWCQGTNQSGYERREWEVENTSLIHLIQKLENRAKELLQYEWEEYNYKNDENIRIVFWFDN